MVGTRVNADQGVGQDGSGQADQVSIFTSREIDVEEQHLGLGLDDVREIDVEADVANLDAGFLEQFVEVWYEDSLRLEQVSDDCPTPSSANVT
jgi:hypothetical protein